MKQSQFDKDRICAISDGIFAIAMTLLVLDLKLPEVASGDGNEEIAMEIGRQAPRVASWFLSFAILARLWITQHALLSAGETRSRHFMAWTFVFLGAVSFIPFPTSLLSEHHDQALSVIIFSATLGVAAVALLGMEAAERRTSEAAKPRGRFVLILAFFILGTVVVASGIAMIRPVLGVWAWAVFLIVATVLSSRSPSVSQRKEG